jgi:hypothetical protein
MKREKVERTGFAITEARDPSTPPNASARDGLRPANAGDADCAEPLAQRASGLERAGAWPATWTERKEISRLTRELKQERLWRAQELETRSQGRNMRERDGSRDLVTEDRG